MNSRNAQAVWEGGAYHRDSGALGGVAPFHVPGSTGQAPRVSAKHPDDSTRPSRVVPDGPGTVCFYTRGRLMTTEELDGPSMDEVGGHYHKAVEMYEAAADVNRGAIFGRRSTLKR